MAAEDVNIDWPIGVVRLLIELRTTQQMESTSASLLLRLKSKNNNVAWARFVQLYTPMIYFWARKCGVQSEDAADLVQDVLTLLLKKLPEFQYDSSKSFRSWLRTVTMNKLRDRFRLKQLPVENASLSMLGRIVDPAEAEKVWDSLYQKELVARAIELMKSEFTESTWQACRQYVIEGKPAAEVAENLGVSVWTIYSAKSRLLNRLRQELDGLLE